MPLERTAKFLDEKATSPGERRGKQAEIKSSIFKISPVPSCHPQIPEEGLSPRFAPLRRSLLSHCHFPFTTVSFSFSSGFFVFKHICVFSSLKGSFAGPLLALLASSHFLFIVKLPDESSTLIASIALSIDPSLAAYNLLILPKIPNCLMIFPRAVSLVSIQHVARWMTLPGDGKSMGFEQRQIL